MGLELVAWACTCLAAMGNPCSECSQAAMPTTSTATHAGPSSGLILWEVPPGTPQLGTEQDGGSARCGLGQARVRPSD